MLFVWGELNRMPEVSGKALMIELSSLSTSFYKKQER